MYLARLASDEENRFALELVYMQIPSAPRRLSVEATREFQKIYKDEFGELISDSDAQQRGVELLKLFAILNQSHGASTTQSR